MELVFVGSLTKSAVSNAGPSERGNVLESRRSSFDRHTFMMGTWRLGIREVKWEDCP